MMYHKYLITSWRSLRKQKLYSLINVLGLTVGLSSFLLIFLYIRDELTYDRFHRDYQKIYRMSYWRKAANGNVESYATSGTAWAPRYRQLMPEVEDYVILTHAGYPGYLHREDAVDVYMEPDFKWATENFFEFFNFPLIEGQKETVLNTLNGVVLTETTSRKYFGSQNPVGQNLVYNVSGVVANLTVTGIMKDPPANSHIKPTFIGNIRQIHQLYMQQYQYNFLEQRGDAFAFTYLKVSDASVLPKIADDWKKYMGESFANSQNQRDAYQDIKFTSLSDMHFEPEMKWEIDAPANPGYIPVFIITALLVLIIACINFMNLATARAANRAREIGLRKTLGSNRVQLIIQFLSESFLMTFLSVLLSGLFMLLILPFFNELTGKSFTIRDLLNLPFIVGLFILTVLVGFLSGSYPALYLSGFQPLDGLRGIFTSGKSAERIRKGLVVFQFSVATFLIVSVLVIYRQMELIHNSNLGKDKDRILSIRLGGFGLGNRYEVFRDELEQNAGIEKVAVANHLPRLPHFGLINRTFRFPDRNNEQMEFNKFEVDAHFAEIFDLDLLAGRNFSEDIGADSNAVLLNEAAVKALQLTPETAIGETLVDQVYNPQLQQQVDVYGQVIGVVQDFPYKSISNVIEPLVIWGTPSPVDRIMYVKLRPGNLETKLELISNKWKEVIPGMPMESWFMDYEFGRLYENEMQMSRIFLLFSGIAIFIAMLGLFALTSYITEQRRREIGIRKVLGATVASVVGLLLKHFFKLICISFIVAVPVAWILMNRWLDAFAYRIEIGMTIFLLTGLLVSLVTFLTVFLDTYRAAIANPVQTLRPD